MTHVWSRWRILGYFSLWDTIFPFNLFRVERVSAALISSWWTGALNNPSSPGEQVPAKGSLKCHFHWGGVSEGRAPAEYLGRASNLMVLGNRRD